MNDNDEKFLKDFRSMSTFGATPGGGVDRQAATAADGQTRNWFAGLLEGHGFSVHYDSIGNQFGLLETVPGAPYVIAGSHLDSQPLGGRYDGAFGVLAAAHAGIRLSKRWREGGVVPQYNFAVVNWFNEEGSRFKPSMMGSSVFTGKLAAEVALKTVDVNGTTVSAALHSVGTIGEFSDIDVRAYAEIHIEQGRFMEENGLTIGLVHSTWSANKYEFIVHGEQSHTGATMIADRRDALLGASMLVVAAREIADEYSTDDTMVITSVGELHVLPNSPVVVAREVNLLLDLRCTDPTVLAAADASLHRRITEIEKRANVEISQQASHDWTSKEYDTRGLELAAEVSTRLDYPHGTVRTLAGHDSTNMMDVVPTVMLFVPSENGVSHNELEHTKDSDIVAGARALTEVMAALCAGTLDRD